MLKSFALGDDFKHVPNYLKDMKQYKTSFDDNLVRKVSAYAKRASIGNRPPQTKAVGIFHSIFSQTKTYFDFQKEVADILEKDFSVSEPTEEGTLQSPYIVQSPLRLRTRTYEPMNPTGVPDPMKFKRKGNLENWEVELLRYISRKLFTKWEETTISINRISSSGALHFTNDIIFKGLLIKRAIENAKHFLPCWKDDNWNKYIDVFNSLPLTTKTTRYQLDHIYRDENGILSGKPRTVHDIMGNELVADKSTDDPGMFCGRVREAWAVDLLRTFFVQVEAAGFRKAMYSLYPGLLHHRGPEDIKRKLQPWPFLLGCDATQFDQGATQEQLYIVIEEMDISDDEKIFFKKSLATPMILENDYRNGTGAIFLNHQEWPSGIPSGHGMVSDFGKALGIFHMISIACRARLLRGHKHIPTLQKHVDQIFASKHKIFTLLNCGDDNVLGFQNKTDRSKMARAMESYPHLQWGVENPISFLGNTLVRHDGILSVYPNVMSGVEKWLVPERSYLGRHRPYAPQGWFERKELASVHPFHDKIWSIIDGIFKKKYGLSMDVKANNDMKFMKPAPEPQSVDDLLFIYSGPESIHYKVKKESVTPELLDMYYLNIPVSDVNRVREIMRS